MVYKHRTKSGKYVNFKNKNAYERSLKGMFANSQTNNHSKRKVVKAKSKSKSRKRMRHRGVKSVKSGKAFCKMCKKKDLPLTKSKCKVCSTETKQFDKAQLTNLEKQMDIHAEEWQKLYIKKMKQRAGFGDHLEFPEEEKLNEALQNYLEARNLIREIDSNYFLKTRMEHDVDVKSGKEFCSMCRAKDKSLTKGKCKFCRKEGKAFEKESDKIKAEAEKISMDKYIVDRISGGWGELKKSKQGKDNTRIVFYKREAYDSQNTSYVVERVGEIMQPYGYVSSPFPMELRVFSVRSGGLISAIRKAKEYYESLD